MAPEKIVSRSRFLYERIEHTKQNGTSYFYPESQFAKEVKELRALRRQYKRETGQWLVFG